MIPPMFRASRPIALRWTPLGSAQFSATSLRALARIRTDEF
jgi:hypothetical protein